MLVSWSSLECPLSLLVSLSLSESSQSFELFFPWQVPGPGPPLLGAGLLSAGLNSCCPKEKMETRLVIWSTSMPLLEPSRKAGWKTWSSGTSRTSTRPRTLHGTN